MIINYCTETPVLHVACYMANQIGIASPRFLLGTIWVKQAKTARSRRHIGHDEVFGVCSQV